MRIIVDAMGGDNAPSEIVKGAVQAAAVLDAEIVLAGRRDAIEKCLEELGEKADSAGIEIADASEVIDMDDDPAMACRRKKESSMSVALRMLRDGQGDAVVSAGSTGALLAGATLIVKRIHGIRRAALAPVLPNAKGGVMIIDCGANAECTPEYLLQFAYMGSYYMQKMLGIAAPRVGLLNNGTESSKGASLQVETYALLEKAGAEGEMNFIGNVEAKGVLKGECDVLVCDGFSGNVLLKAIEGTSSFLMSQLKGAFYKNAVTKLGALLVKKEVYALRAKLDPDNVGGTALLGITKPVIKAHGSSNAKAICNAIKQAADAVNAGVAEMISENIANMKTPAAEKAD